MAVRERSFCVVLVRGELMPDWLKLEDVISSQVH